MYILSEKEFEDILVIHPELIEEGLTLLERQGQLENRRTDLIFSDKNEDILLTELKKDIITIENVEQIKDYLIKMKKHVNKKIRAMLIGQEIPHDIQNICFANNIEWKEIKVEELFNYLNEKNPNLSQSIFIEGKLHQEALKKTKLSFQEYLNATLSPFGSPYTSYQFFKPKDASPYLSENNVENLVVANEFMDIIKSYAFNRFLFQGKIHIKRMECSSPKWDVGGKGASWQGYVIKYELKCSQHTIPCEIYLGTIGSRGNKPIYADEKSRFLEMRIGKKNKQIKTQYGFHKYLNTDKKELLPYYELKFNPRGLPQKYWNEVYRILNDYGYLIKDSDGKKSTKKLWLGEISLTGDRDEQVGNLIEGLFAITILKAHYKGNKKGYEFNFLK